MKSLIQRNPRIGFGCYTVRGTGIKVSVIRGRNMAGDSMRSLAQEYRLPIATIKACVTFQARKGKSGD